MNPKHVGGYFIIKLAPALTTFWLVYALSKYLTSQEYINYSLTITAATLATQLCCSWINSTFAFFASKSKFPEDLVEQYKKNSFYLSILAGCTAGSVVYASTGSPLLAGSSAALSIALARHALQSSILQATFRVKSQVYMALTFSILAALAPFVSNFTALNGPASAALTVAGSYLIATIFFQTDKANIPKKTKTIQALPNDSIRKIATYGLPIGIYTTCLAMIVSVDKFYLANNTTAENYIAAKDLHIGLCSLLSMPVIMTAHPIFFKISNASDAVIKLINICAKYLSILFGAAWCYYMYIGTPLLKIYAQSLAHKNMKTMLLVHTTLLLTALIIYYQKPLEISGKTKKIATLAATMTITACTSIFIAAKYFDSFGGALAATIAQLVYCTLAQKISNLKIKLFISRMAEYFLVIAIGTSIHGLIRHLFDAKTETETGAIWILIYTPIIIALIFNTHKNNSIKLLET